MKIGLTGPSGSGKTTLATYIQSIVPGMEFVAGSASLMHSERSKAHLKITYGYEALGHKAVINKSNENPKFGYDFQALLLKDREEKLSGMNNIITDRTPVDNLTYFMLQCAHNQSEHSVTMFISNAVKAIRNIGLTHLVLVSPCDGWTEDNDSRVANNYYQHTVYSVFQHVIKRYFWQALEDHGIGFLDLYFWDLEQRKSILKQFIELK